MYAILPTGNPVLTHVVAGPLHDADIATVPSGQLVSVGDTEIHAHLQEMFPAPAKFTRVTPCAEPTHNIARILSDAHMSERWYPHLFSVYAIPEPVDIPDSEYLVEVAKRIPIRITYNGYRPKGIVEQVIRTDMHNFYVHTYDLAAWTELQRQKQIAKQAHMGGITPNIIKVREVQELYAHMIRVLSKHIYKNHTLGYVQPSKPANLLREIRGLYKVGTKLFGQDFWKNKIRPPPRSRWEHNQYTKRSLFVQIKARHKAKKVKKPDKQFKAACFVWDLIYTH